MVAASCYDTDEYLNCSYKEEKFFSLNATIKIESWRRAVVRVRIRHNVVGIQARTPDIRPIVRVTNDKRNPNSTIV